MMNFIEIAKKRYSVRNYSGKKVEKEKLDKILQAAHVAPTAANLQPVHLIAVESKEGLEKISKGANIYNAPLAIIVCADHNKAWVRPFDQKQTGDIDAAILTDHMMLEATELGLGTVWVCYFQPDVIRKEFDLPDNLEPINILVMAYLSSNGRYICKIVVMASSFPALALRSRHSKFISCHLLQCSF